MNGKTDTQAALFSRYCGREAGPKVVTESVPCGIGEVVPGIVVNQGDFLVELIHKPGDHDSVGRLMITRGSLRVELFPSKGLSVGQAWHGDRPFFWDPPIEFLPEPASLDPDRTLLINGEEVGGLGFLEAFGGGVEMLGLRNWGMPYRDDRTGESFCLHGDVSMRPVDSLAVSVFEQGIVVTGIVNVRHRSDTDSTGPWYERGTTEYVISKSIVIDDRTAGFFIVDGIQNCAPRERTPDWGYHVQLRPEPRATYHVPSGHVDVRGGEPLPDDFRQWIVPENPGKRTERGFIHRGLRRVNHLLGGNPGAKTLLEYPNGEGLLVIVPPSPFFLSWFSAGGKEGTEFMVPGDEPAAGRRVFSKPWNGVGPEIGASSLDHDGAVDTEVPLRSLKSGEILELAMMFEMLDIERTRKIAEDIQKTGRS